MVDIKRVGKVFIQGDEKFTTKFAKELETGAVQEDIKAAAKAGEKANLAPLEKDGVELGGYESPSPNITTRRQPIIPIPKAILDQADGIKHSHFFPGEIDIPKLDYGGQTTIHTVPTGTGKTQIEKILGNKPIEGLVTEDIGPIHTRTDATKDVTEITKLNGPNGELAQRLLDGNYNIVPLLPPTPEV